MIAKHIVLAASMMGLIAMSGQAYAGATISDTRYWPSEASSIEHNAGQRAENAYSVETSPGSEAAGKSYQGGPKENS